MSSTLSFVEQRFKEFAPHVPFEFDFLDSEVGQLYREEHRLGKIINYLSVLSIFIACLGLLGLCSAIKLSAMVRRSPIGG